MKLEFLSLYQDVTLDPAYLDAYALLEKFIECDADGKSIYDYADKKEKAALLKAFKRRVEKLSVDDFLELVRGFKLILFDRQNSYLEVEKAPDFLEQDAIKMYLYPRVNRLIEQRYLTLYLNAVAINDRRVVESLRPYIRFEQGVLISVLRQYLGLFDDKDPKVLAEQGVCHGLALCDVMMKFAKKSGWWFELLEQILLWDGKLESLDNEIELRFGKTITLREIFERVINYVVYHQGIREPAVKDPVLLTQAELLVPGSGLEVDVHNYRTDKHETKQITDCLSMVGCFKQADLETLLEDSLFTRGNVAFRVANQEHSCSLTYEVYARRFCFYDPNYGWLHFDRAALKDLANCIISILGENLGFTAFTLEKDATLMCDKFTQLVSGARGLDVLAFFQMEGSESYIIYAPEMLWSIGLVEGFEETFYRLLEKTLVDCSDCILELAFARVSKDDSFLNYLANDAKALDTIGASRPEVLTAAMIRYLDANRDCSVILKLISNCYDSKNFFDYLSDDQQSKLLASLKRHLRHLKTKDTDRYEELKQAITDAPELESSPYRQLCCYSWSIFASHGQTSNWRKIVATFEDPEESYTRSWCSYFCPIPIEQEDKEEYDPHFDRKVDMERVFV